MSARIALTPNDDRTVQVLNRTTVIKRKVSPALFVWLAAGVVLLFLGYAFGMPSESLLLAVSVMGGAQTLGAFWRHGEYFISAPGVFMLGLATFVYFPGIYLSFIRADFADIASLPVAVFAVFFSQILIYYMSWKSAAADRTDLPTPVIAPEVHRWAFNLGVALVLLGFALQQLFGLDSSTLAGAAAFAGTVMVVVSVLQASDRLSFSRLALAGAAFALYGATMFSGGGRLILGGLAIAVAVAAARRHGGRMLKLGVLIAVPTGLVVLAAGRAAAVAASRGMEESGLESVVWPLERFAQLISLANEGKLDYGLGSTFYTTAVLFVPRQVWPDKPIGFGAELTLIFRPEVAALGHSEAALMHGEWVFNFGIAGLILLLPIVAWFVNWIDRGLVASQRIAIDTRRQFLRRVAMILAAAGLLDLVWGGTFLYMSRTGLRMLILLAVLVVFAWKAKTPAMAPLRRMRPALF